MSPCTSINELPVELLHNIFRIVLLEDSEDKYLLNSVSIPTNRSVMASVCSWWRDVAINQALLWSTISFSYHTDRPSTSMNWTRLCLSRSKDHDLHVDISLPVNGLPNSRVDPRLLNLRVESFLGALEGECHRISGLAVRIGRAETLGRTIFESILPFSKLTMIRLDSSVEAFSSAAHRFPLRVAGIEKLCIQQPTLSRRNLRYTLDLLPRLRSLSIHTTFDSRHCRLGQSMEPRIPTPHLEHLELINCVLPATAFDAPKLQYLQCHPHSSMGRESSWWATNHYPIETPNHQEVIREPRFPVLSTFVFGSQYSDTPHVMPSCNIIQMHPTISELRIISEVPAAQLLLRSRLMSEGSPVVWPLSLKRIVLDGRDSPRSSLERMGNLLALFSTLHDMLHRFTYFQFIWLQNSEDGMFPTMNNDPLLFDETLLPKCQLPRYMDEEGLDGSDRLPLAVAQRLLSLEFPNRFVVDTRVSGA